MKTALVFVLIGAVLGFLINSYFFSPEPEIIVRSKTEVVLDTLEVENIVYKQLPAEIDTVFVYEDGDQWEFVEEGETGLAVEVASTDTVFEDYGKLHVDYLFPPLNYFDLEFDPFPKVSETIVQTKTIQVPKQLKFYETQKAGFVGGIAFTALIVYLLK